jgi:mediator of RNA polymerase II transcription subunit 4
LDGIKRASNGIISSEELIVYGHKLSMANITSPPVDWMPGDSRRPYPTDIEMRCGSLSRLNRDTSSDRVSEVSKPDVSMETDQPLQESEATAWKVPATLESLLGKASSSFSDHPSNDVMALANGENSPQADSNSSDSSPSSSSSDEG